MLHQFALFSGDRICGLRIKPSSSDVSEITILGVYFPCSDLSTECYSEHLVELERLISDRQHFGPVIITGAFNAHLGTIGGVRGHAG